MACAKYLTDVLLCVHRIDAERQCPGVQVCCEVRQIEVIPAREPLPATEPPSPIRTEPPPPGSCGVRGGSLNPTWVRIFSDDNFTQFGEFPWMLALLRVEETDGSGSQVNVFQCGASLIHPQVAVTAAHCVRYFLNVLPTLLSRFLSVCHTNKRL
jgi:hypothetical protein